MLVTKLCEHPPPRAFCSELWRSRLLKLLQATHKECWENRYKWKYKLESCSISVYTNSSRCMQVLMLGDVMLGRLIDAAVLPHPVSEEWEGRRSMTALGRPYRSKYLPKHLSEENYFSRLWGDTAELLTKSACNFINLECCITESDHKFPKTFNFRTNPANIGALTFVPVHFACIANNHVLDYQTPGMADTVDALKAAGIQFAGAGQDLREASKAAEVDVPSMGHRMHVLSFADHGSGIVRDGKDVWAATDTRPGIWYVDVKHLTDQDRTNLARTVRESAEKCGKDRLDPECCLSTCGAQLELDRPYRDTPACKSAGARRRRVDIPRP